MTSIDHSHTFAAQTGATQTEAKRNLWRAIVLLPPVLLMGLLTLQPWVPVEDFLRDPLAVAELRQPDCCKVYYGAVSNLGILIWTAGAAVCAFAAFVLLTVRSNLPAALFLFSAALFTGLLTIDDLFLVHENVLPAFGVPEPATYGAYGGLGLAYLLVSRREILKHDAPLFVLAIALLAGSVVIDWVFHSDHQLRIVLEDGFKLTGIAAWTGFHVAAARSSLAERLAGRTQA